MPGNGVGFWGAAGLRGKTDESVIAAAFGPMLHWAMFVVAVSIMLAVAQGYCMLWGPVSWFAAVIVAMVISVALIALRWYWLPWVWIVAALSLAAGIAAWGNWGYSWLLGLWPRWRPASTFLWATLKVAGAFVTAATAGGGYLYCWRQLTEITDPNFTSVQIKQYRPDAVPLGPAFVRRAWRLIKRGDRSIQSLEAEIQDRDARIEELEAQMDTMMTQTAGPTIVINGNPDDPPIPEGPMGPERLASYFMATQNNVAELSQRGAKKFGFSREYAKELCDWLIECPEGSPQKYAYEGPRGNPVLLNLGRWMARGWINQFKPENGHPPTPEA